MSEETTKKPSIKKYYDNVNVGKRTTQVVYMCEEKDKSSMFKQYLKATQKKRRVVVVKSKRRADELFTYLNANDVKVTAIHGNHRKELVEKVTGEFNAGTTNLLITTDKILQSLELNNLETIINYDLPPEHEDYFARLLLVDEVGESISFVSPQEEGFLMVIEMRQKNDIKQAELEGFESTQSDAHSSKVKKKKPRHRNTKTKKSVRVIVHDAL